LLIIKLINSINHTTAEFLVSIRLSSEKQGVALTRRNTTGPPSRAGPGELHCIRQCYGRRQTTVDDRRQRENNTGGWPPYTMCRRASNNKYYVIYWFL